MSKSNDGGAAFPGTRKEQIALATFTPGGPEGPLYADVTYPGLSKRDYFAAAALTGILFDLGQHQTLKDEESTADLAYKLADAMIAASEAKP